MPDYKELYLKLFRGSEQAINTLIQAQQEREEICLNQPEPDLKVVSIAAVNKKGMEEE